MAVKIQGSLSLKGKQSIKPASTQSDPFFSQVELLLHMDGIDGGTSFVDSSSRSRTVTPFGNAQTSTTGAKFGTACGLFDSVGDYLSVPTQPEFNLDHSDPVTIEFWANIPSVSAILSMIFAKRSNSPSRGWFLPARSEQVISIAGWDPAGNVVLDLRCINTFPLNQWFHIACVRSNSTDWAIYQNGVLENTATQSGTISTSAEPLLIARDTLTNDRDFNGRLDDIRITKGTARYTSNFTPPTQPFPDF